MSADGRSTHPDHDRPGRGGRGDGGCGHLLPARLRVGQLQRRIRHHGPGSYPFTVDGLIWAASMVILDANRRRLPVPALAKWSLGVGIVATIGATVSAWPALALVGSFELLMLLTRNATTAAPAQHQPHTETTPQQEEPQRTEPAQTPEQAVLADYLVSLDGPGRPVSQRFLAEKHSIGRRKVNTSSPQ